MAKAPPTWKSWRGMFYNMKYLYAVSRNKPGDPERSTARCFFDISALPPVLVDWRRHYAKVSEILFIEFIEQVAQPNAQCLGNFCGCQDRRDTLVAFNEADRGTTDADLLRQGLVREALLLAKPSELVNDLFDLQFWSAILHIADDRGLVAALKRNYSYLNGGQNHEKT